MSVESVPSTAQQNATSTPVELTIGQLQSSPDKQGQTAPPDAKLEAKTETPADSKEDVTPEKTQSTEEKLKAERFASLARKERAIVQERLAIKQKSTELDQQFAAIQNFEKFASQAKQDPMAVLNYMGITYEQLTDFVLNGKKPTADMQVQALNERITQMQQQSETEKRQALLNQRKALMAEANNTLSEYVSEVKDHVASQPDKYELINTNDATNLVLEVIEQNYKQNKKLLSIDEASEMVEKFLESQVEKNTSTKKWKAKANPQPTKEEKAKSPMAQQSQTLNNNLTSSAASFLPPQTEKERMARALAKLG